MTGTSRITQQRTQILAFDQTCMTSSSQNGALPRIGRPDVSFSFPKVTLAFRPAHYMREIATFLRNEIHRQ